MSKTDASGYQNYWNQVKQGVSVEQRYNYKLYGDVEESLNYKIVTVREHEAFAKPKRGTIVRKIDDNGIMQDKIIGRKGNAFKDIDFYHKDLYNNHIFPHEHWYHWKLPDDINKRSNPNQFVWEKKKKKRR